MILELAQLTIRPGQEPQFEAVFAAAIEVLGGQPGVLVARIAPLGGDAEPLCPARAMAHSRRSHVDFAARLPLPSGARTLDPSWNRRRWWNTFSRPPARSRRDPCVLRLAGGDVPQPHFSGVDLVVPLVQTVHILCIAVLLTLVAMTDLKMLGPQGRLAVSVGNGVPLHALGLGRIGRAADDGNSSHHHRARPRAVERCISGQDADGAGAGRGSSRSFNRPAQPADFWSLSSHRRMAGRALGAASLILGVCIVIAGRWIAYV